MLGLCLVREVCSSARPMCLVREVCSSARPMSSEGGV